MPDRANNPSGSVQLEDMVGDEIHEKQRLTKSSSVTSGSNNNSSDNRGEDEVDSNNAGHQTESLQRPHRLSNKKKDRAPKPPMSASTPSTLEKNCSLKRGPSFRSLQASKCRSAGNTPHHHAGGHHLQLPHHMSSSSSHHISDCVREDDYDDNDEEYMVKEELVEEEGDDISMSSERQLNCTSNDRNNHNHD